LPESIQQLTKLEILEISECPALEQWCESEENKMKLAHIKEMVRDLPCLVLTTIFSYNVYSDKIFRSAFLTCMIAPCRYSCVHLFLHCNSCFLFWNGVFCITGNNKSFSDCQLITQRRRNSILQTSFCLAPTLMNQILNIAIIFNQCS